MVDALDVGGGVGVPERSGEGGAPACDPGPHGADRHAEGLRDRGVVEVGHVAQHDRDAEVVRERRERRLQVEPVDDALGSGGTWRRHVVALELVGRRTARRRARRTSSTAAFAAIRCDHVVNAARPSNRAMDRVIAISACCVASYAASGPQMRRQTAWRRST